MSTGTSIAAWRGVAQVIFRRVALDPQVDLAGRSKVTNRIGKVSLDLVTLFFLEIIGRRNGKYEEAPEKFESVLGSKPEPNESAVASYNVACCYSKLNQVQAGLSALEDALKGGFEDFKRIRTDPDLAKIRISEDFEKLMKKFDESFISENAIKSIFGISIKQ